VGNVQQSRPVCRLLLLLLLLSLSLLLQLLLLTVLLLLLLLLQLQLQCSSECRAGSKGWQKACSAACVRKVPPPPPNQHEHRAMDNAEKKAEKLVPSRSDHCLPEE
jgi:hypothetical protein